MCASEDFICSQKRRHGNISIPFFSHLLFRAVRGIYLQPDSETIILTILRSRGSWHSFILTNEPTNSSADILDLLYTWESEISIRIYVVPLMKITFKENQDLAQVMTNYELIRAMNRTSMKPVSFFPLFFGLFSG